MNEMCAIPMSPPAATVAQGRPRFALIETVALVIRLSEWLVIALTGLLCGSVPNIIVLTLIIYACFAELIGAYDADVLFSVRRAWSRMLNAWTGTTLFVALLQHMLKSTIDSALFTIISWFMLAAVALALTRALSALVLRHFKRRGVFNQRVAIYGGNAQGAALAHFIEGHRQLTITMVGIFDQRRQVREEERQSLSKRLVGGLDGLITMIRAGQVDQVIIAMPWSEDIYLRDVVSKLTLTPVRIRLAPDRAQFAFPNRPFVMLADMPMMTLFERPISGVDQLLKRTEDVVLGSLFTLVAMPLLLVTALAIKLDSRGPVFFRQPREGFNNQHFRIWKFRSMHTNTAQLDDVRQAKRADPRITRVGRFIRRTSIDELPQLFNVLSGEMSLVGPRPHAPSTRAGQRLFPDVINTYAARHKVKPGITGWAQVCGWRGETETEEKLVKRVEHDLHYIEQWSVGFDLYILVRTAFALVGARAY